MGNRLIYSVHSLRTKGVTWRPDVEIVTHYPEIRDCELHVMTGLDFQCFGGWEWGRRLVSFSHPPASFLLHPRFPPAFLCPNSGLKADSTEHSWSLVWTRQMALPFLYPPGPDRHHPIPSSSGLFLLSSYWSLTFFNSQILSSSSSMFFHHSQFLTRIYYFWQ